MSDTLHKTKGIVLKTIPYGETSIIILLYTELFGAQSYLMNGIRKATKNSNAKTMYFQPGSILDLTVYHNPFKNLQRIKEYKWSYIYQTIFNDVIKNCVTLYIVELIIKCTKQPDENPELFYFLEDALMQLDIHDKSVTVYYPLFFSYHLPSLLGIRINDNFSSFNKILDLEEGRFKENFPQHNHYLEEKLSIHASEILKAQHPQDLCELKITNENKRQLLQAIELYYQIHIPNFGMLRTAPILKEVLN